MLMRMSHNAVHNENSGATHSLLKCSKYDKVVQLFQQQLRTACKNRLAPHQGNTQTNTYDTILEANINW